MDSAVFFHPEHEREPSRSTRERQARAICARCPVLQQCRHYALTVREPYGVWGGLTEKERLSLLRRRSLTAHRG